MKKLMIAALVAGVAFASQAVSFQWSTSTALIQAGKTDVVQGSGTLYLIDGLAANGGISAENFVKALSEGTTFDTLVGSYSINSASLLTSGKIETTKWSSPMKPGGETPYAGGVDGTWYSVLVVGDNVYISPDKTTGIQAEADTKLGFALKATSSSGTILDVTGGYKGAGWYSVAPEPTSGLLLLLGVAGLALRRRRA